MNPTYRYTLIVLAILLAIFASFKYYESLSSSFSVFIGSEQRQEYFSSMIWAERDGEVGDPNGFPYFNKRDAMLHDLLRNQVSAGMSRVQIEKLLGPPESDELSSWDTRMEVDTFEETHAFKKYGYELFEITKIENNSQPYSILSYYCGFTPSGVSQIVFIVDKEEGLIDVLRTIVN